MTISAPGSAGDRLGRWLRQARAAAGLTQEELAERSGVGVRTIGDLERGRTRKPYPRSIRELADALGVPFPGQGSTMPVNGQPAGTAAPPALVPRQLPAPVRHFAGRRAELDLLTGLLGEAGAPPGPVLIITIGGMAGIGKTAIAVHWAHQVASRFPDGQLYVNLRGFDPSSRPVKAAEAIRGMLDALGLPAGQIPAGQDAQAGLYRSLLAGKRMLVLLDNVREADQIRPLLPGGPGCLVVVTSRRQLAGLVTIEGACPMRLGLLPQAEARDLLAGRLGADRLAAEPAATAQLIRLCAGLPLALAITAARATARPGLALATLATELSDAQHRLDGLETADVEASVRAVFSWSVEGLSSPAAALFAQLGLHPGPDFTSLAAASLAGIALPQARAALNELTAAQLITEHTAGRYTLHDLLRAYAAELAADRYDDTARRDILARALDHYLHTAHAAARLLNPHRVWVPALSAAPPGVAPEPLADSHQVLTWFEAEHQVLLRCVTLAAKTGNDACAQILPWAMTEYLDRRGHWHQWAGLQCTALEAAVRLGDVAGQASARRALAIACLRLGNYRQAGSHLAVCLRLHHQLGDRAGEALACITLSSVAEQQDRYADALRFGQQALALFRAADDPAGQAHALNAVGWYHIHLGRPQQGVTFCQQALSLYRQAGDSAGQARAWDSLGFAEHNLDRLDHATACYQHALAIFRDLGELYHQADTLGRLGDTRAAADDLAAARDAWQQALHTLANLHHPDADQIRAKLHQHPPAAAAPRA